jgi:His-Xaa-Ser repeat protein HxsA
MVGKFSYVVSSLIAAGVGASAANADTDISKGETESFFDQVKPIVENLVNRQTYTLAAHRSHGSHQSHSSHGSHRSYHHPPEIDDLTDELASRSRSDSEGLALVRNENSTPRSTILPSSPAIAQKLKPLPGNSKKFQNTVTAAQLALMSRGYEIGQIGGRVDAKTMAAVFRFQKDSGYAPDGKLTPEVLTALNVVAN